MGNSITRGHSVTPTTAYPALVGTDRKFNVVINAGIDGDNSGQMLARFDAAILAHRPAAVSIMGGVNDASQSRSLVQFEADWREMVNRARATGAKVTVCTPPSNLDATVQARLPDYVNVIRKIAGDTSGVVLFDVYALWIAYTDAERTARMADISHPNTLGHSSIRDYASFPENLAAFTVR